MNATDRKLLRNAHQRSGRKCVFCGDLWPCQLVTVLDAWERDITSIRNDQATIDYALEMRSRGFTYAEIVSHLNDTGKLTARGKPWVLANLQATLYRNGAKKRTNKVRS